MNNKNILIGIVSFIVIVGGLYLTYALLNKPAAPQIYPEVNKLTATDHLKWSAAKKNILIEYSDFQCPACKNLHDYLRTDIESSSAANTKIKNSITFVFRNFPLTQIHANALPAAYAAEAAGQQGKFFEMADQLFASVAQWENEKDPKPYFDKLAAKLSLDAAKFTADYGSQKIKDKVAADAKSGEQGNLEATPTFYLNGEKLDIKTFDEFKQRLTDAAATK